MKDLKEKLRASEAQLKRINELTPAGGVGVDDVAVIPMMVIDSTPTCYDTYADESWMNAALNDLNGPEGVSLQLNHDTQQLPSGRLFMGSLDKVKADFFKLSALAYTNREDLVDDYLKGIVKAVSAGLSYDWLKCSICGNQWRSEECRKHAKKNDHEVSWADGYFMHWPGDVYDGKKCLLGYMMDTETGALRETSPVYKGASEGRLLSVEAIAEFKANLIMEMSAQLSDDETVSETALKAAGDKYESQLSKLTLAIPEPESEGETGEDPPDNLQETCDTLTAENADLVAKNEALKTDLATSQEAVTTAGSAHTELQAKMDEANDTLKKLAEALGGVGSTAEGIIEKALALAGSLTKLREAVVNRIEKLDVQLNGNDAVETAPYESSNGEELAIKLSELEDEFGKKFSSAPITLTEDEPGEQGSLVRRTVPDHVYQTSN